jgi:Fe-S-cluster containining protein
MADGEERSDESVTATVELSGRDWQLRTAMSVPRGPIRLRELLPLVQSFADGVAGAAEKMAEAQGQEVSCKKGCGACCRQLVPMAEVEAGHIRDVVDRLPEPRRTEIRARFAAARRRLEEAGLLEKLLHPDGWSRGEELSVGMTYFRQGIACPFLEGEACSIYRDRPLACREYLVTSPAEHCARPTAETVTRARMPLKVWTAVAGFDAVPPGARFIRWVPLILAPEWAEAHPEELPPRPGPDLLRHLFGLITGKAPSPADREPSLVDELPLAGPAVAPAQGSC